MKRWKSSQGVFTGLKFEPQATSFSECLKNGFYEKREKSIKHTQTYNYIHEFLGVNYEELRTYNSFR